MASLDYPARRAQPVRTDRRGRQPPVLPESSGVATPSTPPPRRDPRPRPPPPASGSALAGIATPAPSDSSIVHPPRPPCRARLVPHDQRLGRRERLRLLVTPLDVAHQRGEALLAVVVRRAAHVVTAVILSSYRSFRAATWYGGESASAVVAARITAGARRQKRTGARGRAMGAATRGADIRFALSCSLQCGVDIRICLDHVTPFLSKWRGGGEPQCGRAG